VFVLRCTEVPASVLEIMHWHDQIVHQMCTRVHQTWELREVRASEGGLGSR